MASRRLALAIAAAGFTLAGVGAASAVPIGASHLRAPAHTRSATVGDSAEAWYATPSGGICLPLVGCLPLPVALSTYPAGTLHVGATLGKETARTYVVPDLASRDGTARGGRLVLPVDSSPLAGTVDLGSAHITACLVTGRLPAHPATGAATAGSPPPLNCSVSAPASYDRGGGFFYVDLGRFLARWRRGTANDGVALIPNPKGASALANWQVSFDGKGASGPVIHSSLTFESTRQAPSPAPTPTVARSAPATVSLPVPTFPSGPVVGPAPVGSPQVAPTATSAVYLVRAKGFRYPAIFIAPLAILAGAIFFARLFTGSTVQVRRAPVTLGHSSTTATTDRS